MLARIARWFRSRRIHCATLVTVALLRVVVPVTVHADEATMSFDIKALPLSEALMAFGVQTGAIVMASSELTAGKISKPVTGQLSRDAALTRMLQGTGLQFEVNGNGAILIVRAARTAH